MRKLTQNQPYLKLYQQYQESQHNSDDSDPKYLHKIIFQLIEKSKTILSTLDLTAMRLEEMQRQRNYWKSQYLKCKQHERNPHTFTKCLTDDGKNIYQRNYHSQEHGLNIKQFSKKRQKKETDYHEDKQNKNNEIRKFWQQDSDSIKYYKREKEKENKCVLQFWQRELKLIFFIPQSVAICVLFRHYCIHDQEYINNRQIIYRQKLLIENMICSKCVHAGQSRPKIRCTPTFYHHPIFGESGISCQKLPRCSATYHSTIFDQNGRRKPGCCNDKRSGCTQDQKAKCCQCCNSEAPQQILRNNPRLEQKQTQRVRPASANKEPKFQKQISFNPNASNGFKNAGSQSELSNHTKLWYNPDKQLLLRECSNCYTHGLPKERKLIELYSNPFYPYYRSEQCGTNCGCGCQGKARNVEQTNHVRSQPEAYEPTIKASYRYNNCGNCKQFCPCDKQCFCTQNSNCPCCENKQRQRANPKKNTKNCVACDACCSCGPNCTCGPNCQCCSDKPNRCDCSNGNCNCKYNCSCGTICKCCPKFMNYGTCRCDKSCICGPRCECSENCGCCPKNQIVICPKQSYKKQQVEQKYCSCGPECGCGPQCRCGPQCKCQQMRLNAQQGKRVQFLDNKGTKSTAAHNTVNNGTKKTKNQQNTIKKSQPVFKSITGPRR